MDRPHQGQRHPLELQALLAAEVGAFMLTATDVTGADMGHLLATALPRLNTLIRSRARPFIATISRQGQISIIHGGARRGGVKKL
jgi:hypothetical protein